VQELSDNGADTMVFRFSMDTGVRYPITDTLTLSAGGVTKTLKMTTTDDHHFANTGWDSIGDAVPIANEPTRFTVDAKITEAHLGVGPGQAITNFRVDSQSSLGAGDFMPGGCHQLSGDCAHTSASDENGANYVAGGGSGSYTLRGTGYYLKVDDDGAASVGVGEEHIVQLTLSNELRRTDQTVTGTLTGADGVTARFHDPGSPSGQGYSDSISVAVPKGGQNIVHVAVAGVTAGASGTLTLTFRTNLGGVTTHTVSYTVGSGGSTDGGTDGGSAPPAAHKSPGAGPAALLLATFALAVALRRRA